VLGRAGCVRGGEGGGGPLFDGLRPRGGCWASCVGRSPSFDRLRTNGGVVGPAELGVPRPSTGSGRTGEDDASWVGRSPSFDRLRTNGEGSRPGARPWTCSG